VVNNYVEVKVHLLAQTAPNRVLPSTVTMRESPAALQLNGYRLVGDGGSERQHNTLDHKAVWYRRRSKTR
jgi:hypothetical protein